ncbi:MULTISPECIES: carbohydrate ABC transporter permease [unclassified Butyrivibrio]|uniref:carbohydrate ABC transporter permease n=1 Tax=unclassified Butyrivibrio TaxID=2639466 RepID=UPI0003B4659E|nr:MULTISPECIES: sugar ABC transporter permease [unclassified Butyrivibrio]SDB19847.1 raffinose/stachyose/melibiose transport system permease protein [Butyrivibrio sp. INlla16]SEL59854.1 raffinose/stachyose/melibiose transport system permease protein [Butyrivibrio sp. ob235]
MNKQGLKKGLAIFVFLLPGLLLFVSILIAPIAVSVYRSLYDWNGFSAGTFIGFDNYVELFTNGSIKFVTSLKNSLILAFFSVFVQLPFALLLALLLGRRESLKERVYLSIFFMPVLISTVVIGQLWLKIYNPDYGLLNRFLEAIGRGDWKHVWVGEVSTALGSIIVPTVWQYVGYHMLLMYAGVKGVDMDLREAAMLDGATKWQVDRYVVIPIIKPIIRVSVIFAVTGSLKTYDLVRILTEGGPFQSTEVPSTLLENMLFLRNRYGMGSTISVMLIILCFAFALLISAAFREKED